MNHLLTPWELRANPAYLDDLREGRLPDGFEAEMRTGLMAEVRASNDETIAYEGGGIAAVYNSRSENLGGFVEVVRPGAAADVLARDPDVRALFNHDANRVLGRTRSGTLRLDEIDEGLRYAFDAPMTSYALDLRLLLERGDVSQSSFAFRVIADAVEWSEDNETGLPLRIIHRFAGLYDVSPVTYPAYPTASSGLRRTTAPERREDASDEARKARARVAYEVRTRRARLRERRR